jgi:hypothetical protein
VYDVFGMEVLETHDDMAEHYENVALAQKGLIFSHKCLQSAASAELHLNVKKKIVSWTSAKNGAFGAGSLPS